MSSAQSINCSTWHLFKKVSSVDLYSKSNRHKSKGKYIKKRRDLCQYQFYKMYEKIADILLSIKLCNLCSLWGFNLRLPSPPHSTYTQYWRSIWFWEMAIALSKVYIYSLHVYKSIVLLLLSSMIIIIAFIWKER